MKYFILLTMSLCLYSTNALANRYSAVILGADYVFMTTTSSVERARFHKDNWDSYALVLGFRTNQFFGMEAGYQQSINPLKKTQGLITREASLTAYNIDTVFYLPYGRRSDFLITAGLGSYRLEEKIIFDGDAEFKANQSTTRMRFGAGMQYTLTRNVALRGMGRYVALSSNSFSNLLEFSGGIRLAF